MFTVLSQKAAWLRYRLRPGARAQLGQRHDFRLGIAGRLGVSFAAVAVLAATANLIVEHGRQIIRPLAEAPINRPALAPTPATAPAAIAASPAAPRKEVDVEPLMVAIDELQSAVARLATSDSPQNGDQLKRAGERLEEKFRAFLEGLDEPEIETLAQSLKKRIVALRVSGDKVARSAAARRITLAEYWNHFEDMDFQVKKTLEQNNWMIFGRIVSRQSLLGMSRDLDDMRRQSTPLNLPGEESTAETALALSQARFATVLEKNAAGLARSQGADWVANERKLLEALVAARVQLAQIDSDNRQGIAPFERSSTEVKALLRSIEAAARQQTARKSPAGAPPGAKVAAAGFNRLVQPALQPAASSPPATEPSSRPAPSPTTMVIASISGVVLLLLLFISITTVRSIVLPVRQFMTTTERLAQGDDQARFQRGAIKELDALAVSFNRMAASLAEARSANREYQDALESRVDERTRQLQHLAQHDPLTGLPNRRQLVERLDAALQRAADSHTRMAVFFIDLDNFKNINDSMGHGFGDLVLRGVAQRLREVAGTSGFAARLGGDEFTLIQENAGALSGIADFGEALVQTFQRPLFIEGRRLIISISAGASIYPDHEQEADALLRAADAALFRAKNSGRARVALFSPELLEAASVKFGLEQGLRRALERGELELWFQPEVSFATMGIQLAEALLRWRLPDGKYLAPADFLSVAEDSGLIRNIHDWVLRTAFQQASEWHRGAWPEARVAINVSARQLLDTSFVTSVHDLLEEFQLPPRCIEIELTETVLQTEMATVEVLRELRGMGISIALDDFGTGYSSLASLERLPLTRVKLDRSLIDTIDTSAGSLAIARAIIGLCENLGLEVTAEGIERLEQLALLLANPATTLQGYLLCRPVKASDLPTALQQLQEQRMAALLLATPMAQDAPIVTARDSSDSSMLARAGLTGS